MTCTRPRELDSHNGSRPPSQRGRRGRWPTFRNLPVLTEAAAEGQGDVGQVHGRVREALGAAVGGRAAHRLWGLGARERVGLGPLPGAGLRLAAGEKHGPSHNCPRSQLSNHGAPWAL